uniref:N-acylglucosamine 2-epimerase n=1 Tax=Phallusia mammillata TaxID=59560 RepID=A0A6F9DR54_9ASCI|nr:N-acylglucosamine 2-epimerase-like [Phallusia mammillata]
MWLQARQVWMYFRLYQDVPRLKNRDIWNPAVKGADFLLKCLVEKNSCTRCPFSVTKDGQAIKIQRNLFSECFFVMAMSETWRATNVDKYKVAAVSFMQKIRHWCIVDDSALGADDLPGTTKTSKLAVAMMSLCLCEQMHISNLQWENLSGDEEKLEDWSVRNLLSHVQRSGTVVLESVSLSGQEIPGADGRLYVPGHAIECGWFLLQHALQCNNVMLAEKACLCFIDAAFSKGWDADNGGLFYFLDADGYCPLQLEWNMKLWWPHCEAMIAFILSYKFKKETRLLDNFVKVAEYTFSKFSDKKGEWYGYLNRKGEVSSNFKGGPWKGCFHVPRAMLMCENILLELIDSCDK